MNVKAKQTKGIPENKQKIKNQWPPPSKESFGRVHRKYLICLYIGNTLSACT